MNNEQIRDARAAKPKRGQCCHEYIVGDVTYFCVEPSGHQCAHAYSPSMYEIERMAKRIADLERELAAAMTIVKDCREPIDNLLCPTQWVTAEGRKHSDLCKRIDAAIQSTKGV